MEAQKPPEDEKRRYYDVNTPLLSTEIATRNAGKSKRGIWGTIWDALPSRPSPSHRADSFASPTSPIHYCVSSLHCDPDFMDSAGKERPTWTAQLSLNWYREGCDTDATPCPLPIPPTWREAQNLEKCAGDEIATATDPLYPGRRVHRRTISFEYDCAASQLEIRTPHRSRRRAAARVNVCLCSKDLEWLQGLDKSIITDPSNFVRSTTGVM